MGHQLLSTFTRPSDGDCDFSIQEDLPVTGWEQNSAFLLSIRKLPAVAHLAVQEVAMDGTGPSGVVG